MPSLIINADDWGLEPATTDAIALCFERGAISSTTAMMWMADSTRAAAIARERSLAVGLHINLDTPFGDPLTPPDVRARHEKLIAWYANPARPAWLYNPIPTFQRLVDECLHDQMEAFTIAFGRPPTHIDGHHHIHLAWNVLLSRALPRGLKMRATYWPSQNTAVRIARDARMRVLRRRFITPDRFYDIRTIHPAWHGSGFAALDQARRRTVEIMVHPGFPDEPEVLLSEEWIHAVQSRHATSFESLGRAD